MNEKVSISKYGFLALEVINSLRGHEHPQRPRTAPMAKVNFFVFRLNNNLATQFTFKLFFTCNICKKMTKLCISVAS